MNNLSAKPKISVVIPVYNMEKYLRECLDSVLGQTFAEIEVICINDGSTDGSLAVLREYEAKDSRLLVIDKENEGLSIARNTALETAQGKYILFVDSDDDIDPELCKKTYAVAEKENADMTFFFCDSKSYHRGFFDNLARIIRNKRPFAHDQEGLQDDIALVSYPTAWSKLWKTDFLTRHDISFPERLHHEDVVFHWKALISNPVMTVVPEKLYHYRTNDDSIMLNPRRGASLDIVKCYEIIRETLKSKALYGGHLKKIFLVKKLRIFPDRYHHTATQLKPKMRNLIKTSIGDDEREFLRKNNNLLWDVRDFYRVLDGQFIYFPRYVAYQFLKKIYLSFFKRFGKTQNAESKAQR